LSTRNVYTDCQPEINVRTRIVSRVTESSEYSGEDLTAGRGQNGHHTTVCAKNRGMANIGVPRRDVLSTRGKTEQSRIEEIRSTTDDKSHRDYVRFGNKRDVMEPFEYLG